MRNTYLGFIVPAIILTMGTLTASASETVRIDMKTGASRVLRIAEVNRVAVGDNTIAGVLPLPGKSQLLINARKAGRTSLLVWTGSGQGVEHDYEITVTTDDLEILAQMVRSTMRNKDVTTEVFGRSIMVRGTVADGAALQQVADVLSRFEPVAKQDGATIINTVVLGHPLGDLQQEMSANALLTGVRADPDGQGNVIVSGRVKDETQHQAALAEIKGKAGRFLAIKGQIVDRLSSDTTTQINVKVRILEIDNTGLSQLGTRLQGAIVSTDSTGRQSIAFGAPQFPFVENRTRQTPFELGPFFRTTFLAPTIDLLMQTGHAKILSEPNLTTIPGQDATFLVGGQIPVPQAAGLGQISVVYQNYGVQLKVNPNILSNGDIATKIEPEVSDLDFQDGIQINGFTIPALKVSRISTNVITAPGESIVMGGMLRRVEQRTIEHIPILSQIPILGRLFQDVRYQKGETNVIFVMTPQVITR
ncbi:MAG: hypothetical protein NVSMB64_10180 [Candidatus Velthaea sp.]